jgi:hypothetical protein
VVLYLPVIASAAKQSIAARKTGLLRRFAPRNDEKQRSISLLEHRDVFEKRDHAEHNDDDAANLFGAAIDRQHVDEVEDENNDQKGDEYADQHRGPPEGTLETPLVFC